MTAKKEEEKLALLRLNAAAPWNGERTLRLLELYGCASEILKLGPGEISAGAVIAFDAAVKFLQAALAFDPEKELSAAEKAGAAVLTRADDGYPEILKSIYDPPLVLYVRGAMTTAPAAAIVGTRKATPYGLRTSARLAKELAAEGVTVVSGLARGVDTAAHQGAIEAGGATWAAMGTGLGTIYPPENAKLAEKIVSSGGALISEFPMAEGGRPANFPRRNRIISGLSHATVVVEGGFESGAMITARFALDQGREVLAVPGQADAHAAKGPNHLIKNGAGLAECAEDVIGCFPEGALPPRPASRKKGARAAADPALAGLSPDAADAFGAISAEAEGVSADELAEKLSWPVQRTAAALFELEVSALAGLRAGRYVRKI